MLLSRALLTGVLAFTATVWAAPQKTTKAQADAASQTPKKATKSAPATAVDLNTASEKDLEAIPGIGRATAKKIVGHRPYQSVDGNGEQRPCRSRLRGATAVLETPAGGWFEPGGRAGHRAQSPTPGSGYGVGEYGDQGLSQ